MVTFYNGGDGVQISVGHNNKLYYRHIWDDTAILTKFELREFIDPGIYKLFGINSVRFMDSRLLMATFLMRDYFNLPITINNYHIGGNFGRRGLRKFNTNIGASYSQHKFGRAIDFNVRGMTAQEVFKYITENDGLFLSMGFTTIEDISYTPTWTHLDIRMTELKNDLLIVRP